MSFELRKLTRRIENRQRRLARLIDRADSDADYARIDRLTLRLERSKQKLDDLTGQFLSRSVESDGQDSFSFAVTAQEGYTQIQITAVDSPDSARFTGGDDLLLEAVASTSFCETGVGGRSYRSTRVIPTEALEEQVISVGDSLWDEWQNYDQVRLSLVRGKDNEDTMASQTFATAEIYG